MKATLYKQIVFLKNWNGYRSTVTEYTLKDNNKTYRMGEIYDNIYQLKKKLKTKGYTNFEIINISATTQNTNHI